MSSTAVAGPARSAARSALLACGIAAGPLYVGAALVQGLTREGFDLARHDVSQLAIGDLGWIQIANFLVSGLLVIACAIGLRSMERPESGGTWGPRLLAGYGAGVMIAGVFPADPADGFPPGTPEGAAPDISWHGLAHLGFAALGFLSLVAACFAFAHHFGRGGHRGWAVYSRLTGVLFLAGLAGTASPVGVLALWIGVLLAWTWIALVARLNREAAS
ncbi:DUF998 domain-containing protein [Streptomyces sp. TS71-3]|uniref:DUF998 domain-containing protein n=1 Tax=Streptomyces sp. TS71-3 TaxID=2733862 RepID=UPI001B063A87|nr:DUF998 domain-containing protein [Streptomyces sp. TS71-3]GHJ35643.1 hypothetical protein Sm713_12520 [Streptomyces sp. TS71-3]